MPPHKCLRVLFVDDETSLRELMRSELPRLGHEVTVCADGREAMKVLKTAKFDAAILDLRMPGMTGIEVLEHLKQVSPDTEAVVMTGHARAGGSTRRWTPAPNSSPATADRSNPRVSNHEQITGTRSGGRRCRVQITEPPCRHSAAQPSIVAATSASGMLPKTPQASTRSAGAMAR